MPDTLDTAEFAITTGPLPASRKIHVRGSIFPEIAVPLREIALSPSSGEPPVRVYDASGAYSDPAAKIDIQRGLPQPRRPWIEARAADLAKGHPGAQLRDEAQRGMAAKSQEFLAAGAEVYKVLDGRAAE